MPEFTEKQNRAMADRIEEAKLHAVELSPYRSYDTEWHGRFADEQRPGRGHDFTGMWSDGEQLVNIGICVYGTGYMAIANVDWMHGGEDCECDVCRAEYN